MKYLPIFQKILVYKNHAKMNAQSDLLVFVPFLQEWENSDLIFQNVILDVRSVGLIINHYH